MDDIPTVFIEIQAKKKNREWSAVFKVFYTTVLTFNRQTAIKQYRNCCFAVDIGRDI